MIRRDDLEALVHAWIGACVAHLLLLDVRTQNLECNMSKNDWLTLFALFGAMAVSSIAVLVVLRIGLVVVGRVRTAIRRRRLVAALPAARTRREKLKSLGDELEAAEKAERERLEAAAKALEGAEQTRTSPMGDYIQLNKSIETATGVTNVTFNGVVGTEVRRLDPAGQLTLTSNNSVVALNDEANKDLEGRLAGRSLVGALNYLAYDADVTFRKANMVAARLDDVERTIAARLDKIEKPRGAAYDASSVAASLGGLPGRPRKEPIWHRRTIDNHVCSVKFFDGSQGQIGHQSNLYGCGLPPANHFFLYGLCVRLDDVSEADRLLLSKAKISFNFQTTRLMTHQLGHVLAKGVDGVDTTVTGKPIELAACENFWVEIEMPSGEGRLSRPAGVTVTLLGIWTKGICS